MKDNDIFDDNNLGMDDLKEMNWFNIITEERFLDKTEENK
jgi:hypothetical protein